MSKKARQFRSVVDPGPEPEPERDEANDLILECEDCRNPFPWTSGEQAFYDKRGFARPKRCVPCRERKRAEREAKAGGA